MATSDTNPSPSVNWTSWRGWPYVLIGVAVLLRLAHIWNSRTNPTFWAPAVDPAWYDQAAQNILRGDWGPFPFFRAPLYPALLAGVYGIFGHDLAAARIFNVILQAGTVWALWKVGCAYFSPVTGILAAGLFAVNGTAIYFATEILSTSTEMLAAILALWATLRLARDHSGTALFLSGMSWGLAAIIRPNFLMVFPVVLAAVWFFVKIEFGRNLPAIKRLGAVSLMWVIGSAIPILPVTAANLIKGGEAVLIATQGGVNFWIGNNPESTGILSVLPGYGNMWTMEDAESVAEQETGRKLRPGELSNFYFNKGWQFLAAHPGPAVRFMIRKSLLFFNRFEISNNKHILHFIQLSPWLPPLLWLNFGLLTPLGVLGTWVMWKKGAVRFLAGLILAYAVSVILFFVTARFRMPVVPWMILLAAAGLVWMFETVFSHPKPRALLPILLLIPGTLLGYINLWNLAEAPVGWARYMEGNAFLKLSELDSARVAFLDALRDGQAVTRSQLNLGVIAFRQGKLEEAKSWYLAALESDKQNVDALNNLGTVSEALGDTSASLQYYQRALTIKPSAEDPRHNLAALNFKLGIAALKAGDDASAAARLEECVRIEPTAIAHYDLAIALGRLGRNQDALNHLEESLRLDPGLAAAAQLRAQIRSSGSAFPEGGAALREQDPTP